MRNISTEIPPFSTAIFGPDVIGIAGGLDDKNPNKPQFTNQFFVIKMSAENVYRTKYEVQSF